MCARGSASARQCQECDENFNQTLIAWYRLSIAKIMDKSIGIFDGNERLLLFSNQETTL